MTDPSLLEKPSDATVPTLFLLHFLGGSARTWDAVAERLSPAVACRGIDLPGFGNAAHLDARTVEEMADYVAAIVRDAAPPRWFLAGHSMGAKIAAIVARRAENGEAGLGGLAGLVLVAGSPPSPEPMDEAKRRTMLGWFAGDAATSREEAATFVRQNVGAPLDDAFHARALGDVVRMNRSAWRAWLERGSREDWAAFVGRLATPAVIVAGGKDGALGRDSQDRLMAPHFRDARTVTLEEAGHLLPIERPAEIADLILGQIRENAGETAIPDPDYRALIHSDRVSARTRAILLGRARRDAPGDGPSVLLPDLLAVLRAVVDRIVPQRTSSPIDLVTRIDAALAKDQGDGWRFAALPPDAEACAAGLATIDAAARAEHDVGFAELDGARRDELLRRVEQGEIGRAPGPKLLDPTQMKLWFEDLRAGAVRIYVSHPATLARIGYSGIANGGDGSRKQGFVETQADHPEAWEPRGLARARP